MRAVVGTVLLAVALTGCRAAVPGAGPSVTVPAAAPEAAVPTPMVSYARITAFCAVEGVVSRTRGGEQARCVKRKGQQFIRWMADAGARPDGTVRPGAPCPAPGAVGTTGLVDFACERRAAGKPRWRKAARPGGVPIKRR